MSISKTKNLVDISPEILHALASDSKRIVALESTIIGHGMPYPQNLQTALELEEIVRSQGAIPAIIAIIDGRIKVGMSRDQLEQLAKPAQGFVKVSTRELAYVLARKQTGATSVAATSFIPSSVGIRVFATGGVGGVHHDYNETMDVSNDLVELGRIPICVVSAGVKSILDIGKTLEYLKTEGVLVMGYQTDDFPAFFTTSSGFKCYVGKTIP